ncbi:hypothetical protein PFICI_00360 [Pestalotiopsis fici W106-1]|uniref:Glutamate carboxypeptidase n=1 Tax=Pestalotiopsis fici (strain W106-1 / CGMCC3.15140) TaxID=1229662 RepID=W3XM22_PESFW|nr:uncharacterized protein PFICI_00360 [Pestalotiopsis fici W106-1]ETS86532.1 hypothetical protein PFICI_00360 [Pestalotiopsis fici W106-1]
MRNLAQSEVEQHMLHCPKVDNLKHFSKTYSSKPHLAGDLQHAESIRDLWQSYGVQTDLVRYDVLQNFPVKSSLSLLSSDGSTVAFRASLTEVEIAEDPTSSPSNGFPAFHGFSANGEVTAAELVYANFGTHEDFKLLNSKGVSVQGKVVICKYSMVFRGLKVRAAQKFGAAAVLIYNDPQEDGELTIENGYQPYPHGPARHPTSIQRGSVDFFSVAVGDPTTPGYPSLPGPDTERQDPSDAIPSIPSLPISYTDALPFLKALDGHGLSSKDMGGQDWKGALPGVEYWTGPSKAKVSLVNQGEYRISPIYNVIGTIPGRAQEIVILGNHHDSWCCGAVDPVSGGAAMNEVVRGLGSLVQAGWQPYRKLILASWDNEEYGLVGSTEFGEEYEKELSENCVAYINVDESTNGGQILGATGSPLLADALSHAMSIIPSPINANSTVFDDWKDWTDTNNGASLLAPMGTGSDYTVFFHHMGIPSLDLVFNKRGTAVYPYHSNYDSHFWIEKFGDPGFMKHLAMARLWGILAVRLAGIPLLGFAAQDYASTVEKHVLNLQSREIARLDLEPLKSSVAKFAEATTSLDELARGCDLSTLRGQKVSRSQFGVAEINKRYREIEKSFILKSSKGLPGRPWYKHSVFAPGLWAGYDGVVFPGILESVEEEDIDKANKWVRRIAGHIQDASSAAVGV